VDIIRTAYYIRGLELMKLIFAVLLNKRTDRPLILIDMHEDTLKYTCISNIYIKTTKTFIKY